MNINQPTRWAEGDLIKEARLRTRKINATNSQQVQRMLCALLKEAGWTDAEFLDAFVRDVTRVVRLRKAHPATAKETVLLRRLG